MLVACAAAVGYRAAAQGSTTLGPAFERRILAPALPESPFDLRLFSTAVKTDAGGNVITNIDAPAPHNLVGAEAAGERASLARFTKIMFSASYFTGTAGHRLDPNNPIVTSGGEHWPFVTQPMRSWPNAPAVTPDGWKLYVTLPGREGYPDSRVAVVSTSQQRVTSWIDLRPAGQTRRTRPDGIAISPLNTAIFPRPYAVVTNEYANFASVIDYIFKPFGPPADSGGRQNISSRNTKHLRAFWDSVPRWLNHGAAHTIREILLAPDSPLLRPTERGFNFRTVRTDHSRAVAHDFLGGPRIVLPTEVPITLADSSGGLAGDAKGPILVSLDPPTRVSPPDAAYPEGRLQVDRLGSDNLAPLVVVDGGVRQINPVLAANHIAVIRDTHGKTSHLSASDIQALSMYLKSLQK